MGYLVLFTLFLLLVIYVLARDELRIRKNFEESQLKLGKQFTIANETKKLLDEHKKETESIIDNYKKFIQNTLEELRQDSVLLPSLIRWADVLAEYEEDEIVHYLYTKSRPAFKAADEIKKAKEQARAYKREVEYARNRVQLYEALAPWLVDYTDLSLEELLNALREDQQKDKLYESEEDPASLYLSKTEWHKMPPSQRNQLALDRYKDPKRKRTPWEAGIMYERYMGYIFEMQGYIVQYHGATQGKEDLGIDLICENDYTILIVQCKRLSSEKGIPVRENVIAQTYGTAQHYKMKTKTTKKIVPTIVTTYILSEEAERFAEYLNVQVFQNYAIEDYPMIKCNISNASKEKIYHLPMDQQYDKVIIGDTEGELYAATIADAEAHGFRRAFRWKGNS